MRYLFTLLLCVVVSLVLSFGLSQVSAYGGAGRGRSLVRWLLFEVHRSEVLQHRIGTLARLRQIKKVIIADLLAGRLTLHEAAEQFGEADELMEDDDHLVPPYQVAQTEEERCRQVIDWVRFQRIDRSERAERIARQLEEEFARQPSALNTLP